MTIEAIIFDLDNTLVNRKKAFREYSERFINKFVSIIENKQISEMIDYIELADRDGYRKKRELYDELLTTLEMKKSEVTVNELLDFWFSEFFKCTVLMDGTIEVLETLKLKQIKLGLITNGSVHSQNSKIDEVKIRDYFDAIIVSDEVEVKKPDKRIFEIAIERLNVNPQLTWYVGDHPINDIKGSMDAGINAIWFEGFMDWDESIEKPRYTINELHDLLKIVDVDSKKPRNF